MSDPIDSATPAGASVLIVNYRGALLTRRAADSVLTAFPQAEIIVVDNSVDRSERATLENVLDSRCRLVVAECNLGFGRACNLGLTLATGRYVLLLNPDARLLPGCIEQLQATLQDQPRMTLVAPRIYWDDEQRFLLPAGMMESPDRELKIEKSRFEQDGGRLVSLQYRQHELASWKAEAAFATGMLSGAALFFRRADFAGDCPLFDPDFFLFYEDTDLARRVTALGGKLLVEPQAGVIHRWRMDAHKGPLMAAGRQTYLARHFPGNRKSLAVEQLRLQPGSGKLPFDFVDLGELKAKPALRSPKTISGNAWLEVSPSPLFMPAAVAAVNTEFIDTSDDWWDNLAPGRYFARLGNAEEVWMAWTWSIAPAVAHDALEQLNATWQQPSGFMCTWEGKAPSSGLLSRFGLRLFGEAPIQIEKIRQPTWRTQWYPTQSPDAALSLFNKAFGKTMDNRLWSWKYALSDCAGIGVWREDALVAFYGWAKRELRFFGCPVQSVQCCDVMTDPGERNMLSREGPFFAATQSFAECLIGHSDGPQLAFGFPSHRHFVLGSRLGIYHAVGKIVELAWSCVPAWASLHHRIRPLATCIDSEAALTECWSAMAASLTDYVLPVRDAQFFRHRYLSHPLFDYECLVVSQRWTGKPLGIFVLRRHEDHVELVDLIGGRLHFPLLISAARRFSAGIGKTMLRGWFSTACLPLVETRDSTQSDTGITIPIAKDAALAEASRNRWFLMAGDCDFH